MNDHRMRDLNFQNLKELSWRRPLTPEETSRLRQWLAARPEFQTQWEEEAALSQFLRRLPAAPVSSNFTARVLQAALQAPPRRGWRFWEALVRAAWLPRCALGASMICVALLSFHGYQAAQRERAARDLARVSRLAALPPMAWLKDFDTIERLNKVQVADDDLLAALQ